MQNAKTIDEMLALEPNFHGELHPEYDPRDEESRYMWLVHCHENEKKICLIKTLRGWYDTGLKETKEIVEAYMPYGDKITTEPPYHIYRQLSRDRATPTVDKILDSLSPCCAHWDALGYDDVEEMLRDTIKRIAAKA